MRKVATLGLVAFAIAGSGYAQQTRVLPPFLGDKAGNSYDYFPFYPGMRRQLVAAGQAFCNSSALLREVAFRGWASPTGYPGRRINDVRMWVGHARFDAAKMSQQFAQNRTASHIQVFRGTFDLPRQPASSQVRPFDIRFKFSRPFVYSRRNGELLLEWELAADASNPPLYPLDSMTRGVAGRFLPYGRSGRFASGEGTGLAGTKAPRLGTTMELKVPAILHSQYPTVCCLGTSRDRFGALRLPLDLGPLGAPNNDLLTSIDVAFPIQLRFELDAYGATIQLPLPPSKSLEPVRFFVQVIHFDARTNRLGVVTTNGVEIESDMWFPYRALSGPATNATGGMTWSLPTIELGGIFG